MLPLSTFWQMLMLVRLRVDRLAVATNQTLQRIEDSCSIFLICPPSSVVSPVKVYIVLK